MPNMYEVHANFEKNWTEILCQQLAEYGYTPNQSLGANEIGYQYFNLRRRIVSENPRKILKSDVFSCPEYLKDGLEKLEQKIRSGENILPHLSRKTGSLTETDPLLNDWGIHHLHLGTEIQEDGFIKRTGPILFVRFDSTHAYFIWAKEHGRAHSPWSEQEMIRIIHRNWPESIEQFRLKGAHGLTSSISDNDIKLFRKHGSISLIEPVPGVVYGLIGGGYSTAGTSSEAQRSSDWYLTAIRNYEKYLRENISRIAKEIYEETGIVLGTKLKFLLGVEQRDIYAIEVKNRVFLKIGSL
ncbi:hypothetical protein [Paenibacillus chitinolyticus]